MGCPKRTFTVIESPTCDFQSKPILDQDYVFPPLKDLGALRIRVPCVHESEGQCP